MSDGLNQKQRAFALAYIKNGGNGLKAAVKAGYSKKTARSQASTLLTHPNIKAFIDKRNQKQVEKFDISQEKMTERYLKIHETCVSIGDNSNSIKSLDSIRDMVGLKAKDKKEIDLNVIIKTGVPDILADG